MTSATIIGGGVCGLVVARALRDRGAEVTLYDKGGAPGPHACSWWAGGMLAPYCELESAEEDVVRLGAEAADWWDAKTGCVTREGSLVVSAARDQADLKRFARRTRDFAEVGGAEIDRLEPDLGGRFSKGLFFEGEAHLSPRAALAALRDGLTKVMLGATMIESSASAHVTARSLLELLSAAYALNPAFGEAEVLEIGVDTRPAFPDNLPRIRRDGELVRVNGLYRHGFLLSPAVGRMVAEMIFDGTTPEVSDAVAA